MGVAIDVSNPLNGAHALTELDKLIENAAGVANRAGTRLTAIRQHVYACLIKADEPLGAYEILEHLDGVGCSKPPTVYRALDWLLELGLIRKVASISKFIALPQGQTFEPVAVMMCRKCGKAEVLHSTAGIDRIVEAAKSQGLEKVQATLEIVGECKSHVE